MSWPECHRQVNEFSGAIHQSYESFEEAKNAYSQFRLSENDHHQTVAHSEVRHNTYYINKTHVGHFMLGFILRMVIIYLGTSLTK